MARDRQAPQWHLCACHVTLCAEQVPALAGRHKKAGLVGRLRFQTVANYFW
jgi:hypothetical protein